MANNIAPNGCWLRNRGMLVGGEMGNQNGVVITLFRRRGSGFVLMNHHNHPKLILVPIFIHIEELLTRHPLNLLFEYRAYQDLA